MINFYYSHYIYFSHCIIEWDIVNFYMTNRDIWRVVFVCRQKETHYLQTSHRWGLKNKENQTPTRICEAMSNVKNKHPRQWQNQKVRGHGRVCVTFATVLRCTNRSDMIAHSTFAGKPRRLNVIGQLFAIVVLVNNKLFSNVVVCGCCPRCEAWRTPASCRCLLQTR